VCAVIVAAVCLVFLQTVRFEFLNYDDNMYVTENVHVQAGLTWSSICWAFTYVGGPTWHPLTWLSHMGDYGLFGAEAGGHHLSNVMLHALNAALLFLLLRRCTHSFWPSVLAALLFAVHPTRVESVAWVAERKDVLSTTFWILTLGAYASYTSAVRGKWGWYALALVLFALGLMAKPMLVSLPCVLMLLDLWPLRRIFPGPVAAPRPANSKRRSGVDRGQEALAGPGESEADDRATTDSRSDRPRSLGDPAATPAHAFRQALRLFPEKIPFFILAVVCSLLTLAAQRTAGALGSLATFPLGLRAGNALVSYVRYVGMTLWPVRLCAFYPFPESVPL